MPLMKRPAAASASGPSALALDLKERLRQKFESQRKPKIAEQMSKYLKNKHPFYG